MGKIIVNLESVLRRSGMSGRALAREIGCHHDTIAKLRRGETQEVSLHLLSQICQVLDCPISTLLRDTDYVDSNRGPHMSTKVMSQEDTQILLAAVTAFITEQKLTWAEMSRQCDMSDNYLGSLRRGKCCSFVAARRITRRLGTDMQSLCSAYVRHTNGTAPLSKREVYPPNDMVLFEDKAPSLQKDGSDTETLITLLREIVVLLERLNVLWS